MLIKCIVCSLNGKKDNLRFSKLIGEEDKYMRPAENCHPYVLIVGIKLSTVTYQP